MFFRRSDALGRIANKLSHSVLLRQPTALIRVHDIKVGLTLFLFFVACFLAFMYAKEKETHHARFTGPA